MFTEIDWALSLCYHHLTIKYVQTKPWCQIVIPKKLNAYTCVLVYCYLLKHFKAPIPRYPMPIWSPKVFYTPVFESFIDYIDKVSKGTYKIL